MQINLKGFIVGNGATDWEVDISKSYPEVVFNFNIIPKTLLDTYRNNNCQNYFNDLKPPTPSKVCNDAWNQINNLGSGLNWYDLYRKVYPDGGLLTAGNTDRDRTVIIDG
jgi:hypothetical protein